MRSSVLMHSVHARHGCLAARNIKKNQIKNVITFVTKVQVSPWTKLDCKWSILNSCLERGNRFNLLWKWTSYLSRASRQGSNTKSLTYIALFRPRSACQTMIRQEYHKATVYMLMKPHYTQFRLLGANIRTYVGTYSTHASIILQIYYI